MTNSPRPTPRRSRWLILAALTIVIAGGVAVYFYRVSSAQTVSPPTATVAEPNNPAPVKVQILTAENKPDAANAAKVKFAGAGANFADAAGDAQANITFTPPEGLAGKHVFQFLDQNRQPIAGVASVEVNYTAPAALPTPTPDIAWIERFNAEARRSTLASRWWYSLAMILVFVGAIGTFIGTMARGILRSRATFRTPTGLPMGTFRAILAYTLVCLLGFYVLTSLLVVSVVPPPEFLLGIVATVVGFYFGSRSGDEAAPDASTGTIRGIVRKGSNPVSGAIVKFRAANATEPYSRITDVAGRFDLRGAKPDTYTVIAETKIPPATAQTVVTVAEGSDHEIEIVIDDAGGEGGENEGGNVGGGGGEDVEGGIDPV